LFRMWLDWPLALPWSRCGPKMDDKSTQSLKDDFHSSSIP
jgi:hypothetical protein